jgi:hypothetical protein
MVALANAQQAIGHFDLGAAGMPRHELVTSCEPCSMCYGAIPWAGVRKVLCGARGGDAEAIGFDEGPKPKNWVTALKKRGIDVSRGLCRDRLWLSFSATSKLEESFTTLARDRNVCISKLRRGGDEEFRTSQRLAARLGIDTSPISFTHCSLHTICKNASSCRSVSAANVLGS